MLSSTGLCEGPIPRPEGSYTECGVLKCDLETSTMMGLRPSRAVKPRKKKKSVSVLCLHSKVVRLV